MNAALDAWRRYDHGVGPLPTGSRPEMALGESAVCDICGAVYRSSQLHRCKRGRAA